jgi:hypothetical protein
LDTVDLAEPDPRVFRFENLESNFRPALDAALATPASFDSAAPWRAAIAWPQIAVRTATLYASVA